MQTPNYEEVLSLAQCLNHDEQVQLWQVLSQLIYSPITVEGTDEVISATEVAESEAAFRDYQAGCDRGISSRVLKQQLMGENLG